VDECKPLFRGLDGEQADRVTQEEVMGRGLHSSTNQLNLSRF